MGAETKICDRLRKRKKKPEGNTSIFQTATVFLPTVGVLPALSEAFEDREEELSARARGAPGGGLAFEDMDELNSRP